MLNVATATPRPGSVRYMGSRSPRALPDDQNERLRGVLRDLVRDEFGGTLSSAAKALGVTDLWVPRASPRDEARLLVLHEFLHGMLLRRGDERCESDAWMATAAWIARAMLVPGGRGVTLFPEWFIHLTPRNFWA